MSVNKVWLIGHVAARPRTSEQGDFLLLATVRSERSETVVDRHLVRIPAAQTNKLATGALILVEGCLSFDEAAVGHVVVAARAAVLVEPDPPASRATSAGIHASPVPHDRSGHFRRVAIGSARERLVWVRPASVGDHRVKS